MAGRVIAGTRTIISGTGERPEPGPRRGARASPEPDRESFPVCDGNTPEATTAPHRGPDGALRRQGQPRLTAGRGRRRER